MQFHVCFLLCVSRWMCNASRRTPPWLVPSDFIIRFGAMTLKAMLCLTSSCVIRSRKKGKAYMLLEYVCLLYRSVVAAPLWVRYLSTIYSDEEGTDQDNKTVAWIFAVVVTAVYLMVKVCTYV